MSIYDIYDKCRNEEYKVTIPYANNRDNYRKEAEIKRYNFKEDLIKALVEDYNINEAIAKEIYDYAWEDGHSGGYYEVVIHAEKYAGLIEDCLKLQ